MTLMTQAEIEADTWFGGQKEKVLHIVAELHAAQARIATLMHMVDAANQIAEARGREIEMYILREHVNVDALRAIAPWIPKTRADEGGAAAYSENVVAADKVRKALSQYNEAPVVLPPPRPSQP